MARTYLFMNRPDDAIASYQKSLKADASNTTTRTELATLYMKLGRTAEAEKQFKQVVATQPSAEDAISSLGYLYIQTDRLSEAAVQFDKVMRMDPKSASAHFGMGQVRSRQGDANAAIDQFQQAIALDRNYAAAHSELALTYFAQGRTQLANQEVSALQDMNTSESQALAQQVNLAMFTPKIAFMDSTHSTFRLLGVPNTPLAEVDSRLATPGASVTLSVSFVFNQSMDIASVQNPYNWSITRASGGEAGVYNNGVNLGPSKDANILPIPISVSYDPGTGRATVSFRLTQNAAGDAVIDPAHLVFQFRGTDIGGNPMDPSGDQFDGWTMLRF
jgi:Tfp pilus assembly protein PilF